MSSVVGCAREGRLQVRSACSMRRLFSATVSSLPDLGRACANPRLCGHFSWLSVQACCQSPMLLVVAGHLLDQLPHLQRWLLLVAVPLGRVQLPPCCHRHLCRHLLVVRRRLANQRTALSNVRGFAPLQFSPLCWSVLQSSWITGMERGARARTSEALMRGGVRFPWLVRVTCVFLMRGAPDSRHW